MCSIVLCVQRNTSRVLSYFTYTVILHQQKYPRSPWRREGRDQRTPSQCSVTRPERGARKHTSVRPSASGVPTRRRPTRPPYRASSPEPRRRSNPGTARRCLHSDPSGTQPHVTRRAGPGPNRSPHPGPAPGPPPGPPPGPWSSSWTRVQELDQGTGGGPGRGPRVGPGARSPSAGRGQLQARCFATRSRVLRRRGALAPSHQPVTREPEEKQMFPRDRGAHLSPDHRPAGAGVQRGRERQ